MTSSHRLQMPVSTPGCHPYFWPVSKTPSSGLINFLEWLTEPRQTVSVYLPVHHKRVGFRNSQMGETQGTGKGHGACVPSLNTLLFQTSVQSPTQKLREPRAFGGLWSFVIQAQLMKSSATGDRTQSPAPLPFLEGRGDGVGEGGAKSSNSMTGLAPLETSPYPLGVVQKSPY